MLRIELAFFCLKDSSNSIGKLSLYDTAGFNEALLNKELELATKHLLSDSSAIVYVVDASQSGTKAESDLKGWVKEGREVYICANKKDQYKDVSEGNVDTTLEQNNLRKYKECVPNLKEKDIFPTNSRIGLFSSKLQQYFRLHECYPKPRPADQNNPMAEIIKECFGKPKLKNFDSNKWRLSEQESNAFTEYLIDEYSGSGIPSLINIVFVETANNIIQKVFENFDCWLTQVVKDFEGNLQTYQDGLEKDLEELRNDIAMLERLIEDTNLASNSAQQLPVKIKGILSTELGNITTEIKRRVLEEFNKVSDSNTKVNDDINQIMSSTDGNDSKFKKIPLVFLLRC